MSGSFGRQRVGYFVGIKILQLGLFLGINASRIWVPQVWHWIGGWPIPRSTREYGHVVPWKPTWSTLSRVLDTIFPPEMAVVGFHVKPPISPVWVGHFIVALKGAIDNPVFFFVNPRPVGFTTLPLIPHDNPIYNNSNNSSNNNSPLELHWYSIDLGQARVSWGFFFGQIIGRCFTISLTKIPAMQSFEAWLSN